MITVDDKAKQPLPEPNDFRSDLATNSDERSLPLPPLPPPPSYFSHEFTPPPQSYPQYPRVNFFYVAEEHKGVTGKWLVDPNRPTPAMAMPSLNRGETPDNIHLFSKHGNVSAEFVLDSETSAKTRIHAESTHGTVKVSITYRGPNQRIHLFGNAKHGGLTVGLPQDFEGLVTLNSEYGAHVLSKGIQERLTPIRGDKGNAVFFIGRWEVFMQQDGSTSGGWQGDEAILQSTYGPIKVAFTGEDTGKPRRGFLSMLF